MVDNYCCYTRTSDIATATPTLLLPRSYLTLTLRVLNVQVADQ